MNVRIKKLDESAVIPKYAKESDAGLDLTAVSMKVDERDNYTYGVGLAVEIPEGYVGLIFPRSSIADKDLVLSNSVGVIDSGYRGELIVKFKSKSVYPRHYVVGERVAQLLIIPHPYITFIEAEELSSTERGAGGFGSTGV